MQLDSRIPHRIALGAIIFATSACYEGIEPLPAETIPVEAAVEDEPFQLVSVAEDGFEARLVLDGEAIAVVSETTGAKTRVTVIGEEHYGELSVDFTVGEGTGTLGGRAIEEIVEQEDRVVESARAREVLDAVSLGAAEIFAQSAGEGQVPDAPGTDPVLDGLRLLSTLDAFTHPRGASDFAAPPEAALDPDNGFAADPDPAAGDWFCMPEWSCWPKLVAGCARVRNGSWASATKCAVAVLEGCGILCPQEPYIEFWAGNCLYAASIYANHMSAIYCVGGGCGSCY